jgi:hypothetical protein
MKSCWTDLLIGTAGFGRSSTAAGASRVRPSSAWCTERMMSGTASTATLLRLT